MSQMGGGMNFYGELPDSFNLVVNPNHQLVIKIADDLYNKKGDVLAENDTERKRLKEEIDFMENEHKKKKADEISQVEKDDLEKLRKEMRELKTQEKDILESYGTENKVLSSLLILHCLQIICLRVKI